MVKSGMMPGLNDNMTLSADFTESNLKNSNENKKPPASSHKPTLEEIK